jgi:hypothetical protein
MSIAAVVTHKVMFCASVPWTVTESLAFSALVGSFLNPDNFIGWRFLMTGFCALSMGPAAVQPVPLLFLVNYLYKIMTVATATREILKLKSLRVRYCTNILRAYIAYSSYDSVSLHCMYFSHLILSNFLLALKIKLGENGKHRNSLPLLCMSMYIYCQTCSYLLTIFFQCAQLAALGVEVSKRRVYCRCPSAWLLTPSPG